MMPGQERQDVEQGGKSMYVFSLLMQSHNTKDLGGVFFVDICYKLTQCLL